MVAIDKPARYMVNEPFQTPCCIKSGVVLDEKVLGAYWLYWIGNFFPWSHVFSL
jgi:hypothetical protein